MRILSLRKTIEGSQQRFLAIRLQVLPLTLSLGSVESYYGALSRRSLYLHSWGCVLSFMCGDGGLYVVDFVYVWRDIDLFVSLDVFII